MPQLKRCLGVDLGHHTVKIVELALERNAVRTIRAASAPTGVTPEMDPEARRSAIVSAAKNLIKANRFSTKDAVYAVPGQKVFVRRFRLPKTSEERLQKIIQYEAKQQIPFPLDRTLLQYQYVELEEEGEVEVLLVAVRSDEVRDFMLMVDKVGPRPVIVSVSAFAVFSSNQFINMTAEETEKVFEKISAKKKKPPKPKKKKKSKKGEEEELEQTVDLEAEEPAMDDDFVFEEVKGYLNIGATYFDLAIPRTGKSSGLVGFNRTVPMGGNEMTRAIQRNLNVESFEDAERIKVSSTQLMAFNFDFEGESEVNEDASLAVTEVADRMVTEIRRSLDFYITQPDGMAVDRIVASGGQALLGGFDTYLEEKLSVPVEVVKESPEATPFKWQQSAGPLTQYLVSIGLALQGMGLADIAIDFLPEDRKVTRDFPYRISGVMIIFLIAMVILASQSGSKYIAEYQKEKSSFEGQMDQLRDRVTAVNDVQQDHRQLVLKYEDLAKAFGQRDYWLQFVGRLASLKPPEVLLEDVQMEHDGSVLITARSEVQVSAADFIDQLNDGFGQDDLARIENIDNLPQGFRFYISLKAPEKVNHLQIFPTPTATAPTGDGRNRSGGGRDR